MDDTEFDALVNKIQGEVFTEARKALGPKGFERWRHPKHCGRMEQFDAMARLTGSCGDTMEMYIRAQGERVTEISYFTDGCSSSSVAGSFAAELALGRSFVEILDLRGSDVLDEIGQFPEEDEHCTHLAITTLQEALNQYLKANVAEDTRAEAEKSRE